VSPTPQTARWLLRLDYLSCFLTFCYLKKESIKHRQLENAFAQPFRICLKWTRQSQGYSHPLIIHSSESWNPVQIYLFEFNWYFVFSSFLIIGY